MAIVVGLLLLGAATVILLGRQRDATLDRRFGPGHLRGKPQEGKTATEVAAIMPRPDRMEFYRSSGTIVQRFIYEVPLAIDYKIDVVYNDGRVVDVWDDEVPHWPDRLANDSAIALIYAPIAADTLNQPGSKARTLPR